MDVCRLTDDGYGARKRPAHRFRVLSGTVKVSRPATRRAGAGAPSALLALAGAAQYRLRALSARRAAVESRAFPQSRSWALRLQLVLRHPHGRQRCRSSSRAHAMVGERRQVRSPRDDGPQATPRRAGGRRRSREQLSLRRARRDERLPALGGRDRHGPLQCQESRSAGRAHSAMRTTGQRAWRGSALSLRGFHESPEVKLRSPIMSVKALGGTSGKWTQDLQPPVSQAVLRRPNSTRPDRSPAKRQ
jgi:hypothetical protein